jgi:tetratricopeptide (TPR) repeat protein/GR25 family glycosyltransferase involved in LPS biosynthesis
MATISEALAIALQHHQAGRLDAAEQIYQRILQVEPEQPDALHFLGVLTAQRGRPEAAAAYIARAIAVKPDVAPYHLNLGLAYQASRKPDEAIACYQRALQLQPEFVEVHYNLGNAWNEQGQRAEAAACYRRAIELRPNYAEAHYNLGKVLQDQGKLDEAIACYRRAIELKPDYAEAHNNLGTAFKDQGKLDETIACCRRAVELKPDYAEAHNNLGIALASREKLDEAVACYRRALQLKPDYAEAHYNLGKVIEDQGKSEEAAACYRWALELKPDYAEAHLNLGNVLTLQRKLDEAVACFGRALELKPDYADAHLNCAHLRLLTGDWQRGWPEYEWRWQTKQLSPRPFQQPLWDGGSLAGKTILLHAEQGLGDTIQFIRYASIVKEHGAGVIVECQKPLLGLLEGCPGIDRLIGPGNDLPAFDVHAPLLSVPGIVKTSPGTVPAQIPYLQPKAGLVEQWRKRLIEFDGFKIGISWQGNPKYHDDRLRSIPLRYFAPLAGIPGVRLISIQKGVGTEQLAEVRDLFPVMDLAAELDEQVGPFMDTAAVMKNVDLLITSDTAAAHLAGALGVPVWVALPFVPDWRWLLDRSDSPWYPTMRLFRQEKSGDWTPVFQRMAEEIVELRQLAHGPAPQAAITQAQRSSKDNAGEVCDKKILYLNLSARKDRNERFLSVNATIAGFQRVEAVDGKRLRTEDLLSAGVIESPLRTYTAGALGCAMSHKKVWERCVAAGTPLTVAEDDAVFNRHFAKNVAAVLGGLPQGWDIILWGWNFDSILHIELIQGLKEAITRFDPAPLGPRILEFQERDYDVQAMRLFNTFGIVCYTVSPEGAQRLLMTCFPLREELIPIPGLGRSIPNVGIDSLMNKCYRALKSYVCFPPLVWTENDKSTSDVRARAHPRPAEFID